MNYSVTYTLGRFGKREQTVRVSSAVIRRVTEAMPDAEQGRRILTGAIMMKLPIGAKLIEAKAA